MMMKNQSFSHNYVDITITNGPQNTTVCMNAIAKINCGYTGADPNTVVPQWQITFRSDDGSIISNDTVDGHTIINEPRNGLQWSPDLKLLVGPVNMTHNKSSYQCIINTLNCTLMSSVGTITVVGKTI